jgi:hypothetical protein
VGQVDTVEVSQAGWRKARRDLNGRRGELARAAAELYRPEARIGATFLARKEWTPSGPLKLEDIQLEWSDGPAPLSVTGAEPEADSVLPLRAPGRRYDRYTSAIRYLDPPSLFENRSS